MSDIFALIPRELLERMAQTSSISLPTMFDSLPTELQDHHYLTPLKQAFIHTAAAKYGTITYLKNNTQQRQRTSELE